MKQFIEQAKPKLDKAIEHLKVQLSGIRSGRAIPALVEHVKAEAYGTMTPLIELAGITAPEPRLLVVSPWDKSIIKEVEKALQAANLGVQPTVDGDVVRLNFPSLTEERRRELVKMVNNKLEETKVAIRNVREEIMKELKEQKGTGEISEDDFFATQKDLQKIIDEQNESIKQLGEEKEKEIMTI
ncbi:MAG: Ribosome-recycling factor [Parcubacteria group bacterium GW2011_GWA1_43_27]|uniref:Ribosome-recycling factor n=1 Tax=Candidatus Veblenbacteria bacterium RIFOXYD1_FULL_43_11 TaxID=1802429 RepID=A0A1G2Q7K5_9BACT|nr:MAG: Ribosome-recycling factor [Parcubacteria group bacterium GW2011_GWA1_43_27]KKT27974.1 MAG: Ribosome-recycling factor [Parcubacteria group bacterium GW2011_GWF1_43_9]OHA56513.1 MAG: ribosome recycling factor [Candidatus Veblenbacteria bacterium RIFOXYD1_FULL_43_11]HAO81667.1 ribosome recycling factor [Candidatus Veblenbacteria bacterium]